MSYFKINGVLPPMITPFKENGDVDYEAFVHNIIKWNETDLAGYLVLGSNSEASYLKEEEKLELIRLTVENNTKNRLVMVGTGMESARETIELTNKAADLGADCALLLTPFYYGGQMTDEALVKYFVTVADNTRIPILIYNVTKFTHINVTANFLEQVMNHPNIIGMKDSTGNVPQLVQFGSVLEEAEFNLMVGTVSAWYPALTLGIEAGIFALANCCPDECAQMQSFYKEGKEAESVALYRRMFPVNAAVTGKYGIAGLKYVATQLGYKGGYVRLPLLELSEQKKKELDQIMKTAGLQA